MIRKPTRSTDGDQRTSAVEYPAPAEAGRFLRTFLPDPLNMLHLRRALVEERTGHDISRLSDQQVIDLVGSRVVSGHFRLRVVQPPRAGVGHGTQPEPEDDEDDRPTPPPPITPEETHWIEFELVDTDGEPVPDEAYHATFPDGRVVEGNLDRSGRARFLNLSTTGNCVVKFPGLDE